VICETLEKNLSFLTHDRTRPAPTLPT